MKKSLTTFFTLAALFSCTNNQPKNEATQETPKALQADLSDTKSYSRSGSDLTEELYAELVGKTPELKKLEDDMDLFWPKPDELNEKFNKYNEKSNSYYTSANYHATAISDSLLKAKVLAFILASLLGEMLSWRIKSLQCNMHVPASFPPHTAAVGMTPERIEFFEDSNCTFLTFLEREIAY